MYVNCSDHFLGKNQMNRENTIKNVSMKKKITHDTLEFIPIFPTQIQPQPPLSPPLLLCVGIESHFQHFHC